MTSMSWLENDKSQWERFVVLEIEPFIEHLGGLMYNGDPSIENFIKWFPPDITIGCDKCNLSNGNESSTSRIDINERCNNFTTHFFTFDSTRLR